MIDLSWLALHTLSEVHRGDYEWHFVFSEGVALRVECPWRLLEKGRIRVSSDDDGQRFGWPEPIDAEAKSAGLIQGSVVRSVTLRPGVLDLLIEFDDYRRLEVLPISSGYEAWQIDRPADRSTVVAVGGGELARFVRPDSSAE